MLSSRFLVFCCLVVSAHTICVHAEDRVDCSPILGVEGLWGKPQLRFIIVGEMHGTNETPAIFKDLVCAARDSKRPIIVGVELRDQPTIDRYILSLGTTAAFNAESGAPAGGWTYIPYPTISRMQGGYQFNSNSFASFLLGQLGLATYFGTPPNVPGWGLL